MKTLYVTDLDGTLLNTKDKISQYSLKTINHLVRQGLLFTYATARSFTSASVVTKGLFTNIPVVVYNGCLITHPATGEVYSSASFSLDKVQKIIYFLKANHIFPLVYSYIEGIEKVTWLRGLENEGIKRYLSLRKDDKRLNPVAWEDMLYKGEIFYFTCIGEKEELLSFYNAMNRDSAFRCTLQQELYRPEYWCEVMPAQATKANAVLKVKQMLFCDKVVSFGDAVNDIPLFQVSDECYAVENAVNELKQYATGFVKSNDWDGVAKWLWKRNLEEK